jgi:hypothetical protein
MAAKKPSYEDGLFARAGASMQPVKITVPGAGEVYFRPLTGEEAEGLFNSLLPDDNGRTQTYKGLASTMCRPDGSRFLDPSKPEDLARLAAMSWKTIRALSVEAQKVSDTEAEAKNG